MPHLEQPPAKVFGNEKERTTFGYRIFVDMLDVRNEIYPQFNNRRLIDFVDDSRKRVNSYAPGKNEYDPPKEGWQNNSFDPITRNKLKAIAASVASSVPKSKVVAVNKRDQIDLEAAALMTGLLKYSRQKENVALTHLYDVWNSLADGTVIKYEGYLKTKKKVRLVKSYNQVEGTAEVDEKEMIVDDKCIEVGVPIDQFYISDFSIFDVQDQPKVAWVRYLFESELKTELGHHKNYEKVLINTKKQRAEATGGQFTDAEKSFYNNRWLKRTHEKKREYEVIQLYSKEHDFYRIMVNGLEFLDVPLLWGRSKKMYPFAKGIFEPFAGGDFFYGNAIGTALQFGQDVTNTLWNMMIDKVYRSIAKPRIIGLKNQDAFEQEDEDYDWSTNIYVNDVDQFKEMPIEGVNQSEMAMFGLVKQETDLASVDQIQQGVSGSGVTATEIRTANAKARQLKGIFFTLLEDLWLQKNKLRVANILTNYTVPRVDAITGEGEKYRTFAFPDEMKDGEGGIKEIQFVKEENDVPSQKRQDEEMKKRADSGTFTEIEIFPSDYLDSFQFDVAIVPESLHAIDKAENIADMRDLAIDLLNLNPEFWLANKDDYTKRRILPAYGESIENFKLPNPLDKIPLAETAGATPSPAGGSPAATPAALPSFNDANKLNR